MSKDELLWQLVALMEKELFPERSFPWKTHEGYRKWRANRGW